MKLAILTTGRQDYGILRSTIRLASTQPDISVAVWAGGMHLNERFGMSVDMITADQVVIARKLDFVAEPPDLPLDASRAMSSVAEALAADRPDALMLAGDRGETLAAGVAAVLLNIPIIHLHGGEETEGAVDNLCRHALTKLSHLHLVSHELHAERVIQMGEAPEDVFVVGAPGLDNLYRDDLPKRSDIALELGRELADPLVLVTVHPATLGDVPRTEVKAVARAMESVDATYLVTQPNADQGGASIREFWVRWSAGRPKVILADALGAARHWALLREASAVLGNSSSGIIEAPACGVPVVNVGDRQRGRMRYGRVYDVPADAGKITEALRLALAPATVASDANSGGYMQGPAAPRILKAVREWFPRARRRKFFRVPDGFVPSSTSRNLRGE
jgi:UDP-N-acetylglucosamine 2-epimerase (non-hydrolysing)